MLQCSSPDPTSFDAKGATILQAYRALVVIPTLNEAKTIEAVIARLSAGLPLGAGIVVADGGSTDGTQAIVERIGASRSDLTLMPNPKKLQSAGLNEAVRRFGANYDVVVRCDAHAGYPEGFVARLIETFLRADADSVVVPMDSRGDGCLQRAVAWVSDTPIGSGGSAHRGGRMSGYVDHGHHALMRISSFLRAGGYDEAFSHNEDAELDCRLRALGSRIYMDGDTRLDYFPRATFGGLARQYFGYGRGRSRTVRRHPASLRLRQFAVPSFLTLCVLAILLSPVLPLLLLIPAFYAAILLVASLGLAAQHRSACGLLGGPAALTMHASWATGFIWGLVSIRERRWSADAPVPAPLSGEPA